MSKFLLSGGAEAATCELRLQLFRVYSETHCAFGKVHAARRNRV